MSDRRVDALDRALRLLTEATEALDEVDVNVGHVVEDLVDDARRYARHARKVLRDARVGLTAEEATR